MESLINLLDWRIFVNNPYKSLLNDFAFKYVFGAGTKESNAALKAMLEVFLDCKIQNVQIKNPELTKNLKNMKDSRFDIFVQFDDSVQVDIEMQVYVDAAEMKERMVYYCAIIHANQNLKGKLYSDANRSIVLANVNGIVLEHPSFCQKVGWYTEYGEEFSDAMELKVVELPKLNQLKTIAEMSEKEKLMYYFLHCQDKDVDSKIKELTETNEVVQMVDKRVDQIEEDRWKKLSEEFARLHENEREMRIKKYGERKMKEAEEKGRQETLKQNIQKFSKILSSQQIADTLDLTLEEVESYLK